MYQKILIFIVLCICHMTITIQSIEQLPKQSEEQNHNHDEMEWWENTVFYQIYPRSFKDSNGDGIGDLQGIAENLVHLKDAGIGATWLSPVFHSPMVDFGYDIQNYTAIDPIFGSMKDMEALIQEANRLHIKIILDFVPNHSSDQCEWFKLSVARDPEYEDFYVWHNGSVDANNEKIPPNNWRSVFTGSAWTFNEVRNQFYLHQFTPEQPDFNFNNPKVIEAFNEILTFWVEKGVSGFRVDAINHLFEDPEFRDDTYIDENGDLNSYENMNHIHTKDLPATYEVVYNWRKLLDELSVEHRQNETILMMTEAYADLDKTMLWYQNEDGSKKGSHIPFNFVLITNLNETSSPTAFKDEIENYLSKVPTNRQPNWVAGNHDRPRIAYRYGEDRIDAMNTLVLTLPGVGITYYGEEIGMIDNREISFIETQDPAACGDESTYQEKSRDPVRTPFQWNNQISAGFSTNATTWLPVHGNYMERNLELQMNADKSYYNVYKELIKLRNEHTMMTQNIIINVLNDDKVLIYKRFLTGYDSYIIVINFENSEQTIDISTSTDIGSEGVNRIAVVNTNSKHIVGEIINVNNFILDKYESIVIRQSNAVTIKLSLIAFATIFLRYFL